MAHVLRAHARRAAPAAVLGGSLIAGMAVAAADEGLVVPGRSASGAKLPIYTSSDDTKQITLVQTENPLVPYIATARESTCNAVSSVREVVEEGVQKWIGFERRVEREVKQVVTPDEPLVPGIIYVAVAGLTGSVLTRTRSFPVRFLAPPVFALAALPYFLPKTAHNLRVYVSDIEDKYVPDFAAKHDRFNSALETHWHIAVEKVRGASDDAQAWTAKAANTVESSTGLRVGELSGRVREAAEKTAEKARADIVSEKKRIEAAADGAHDNVAAVAAKVEQNVSDAVTDAKDAAYDRHNRVADKVVDHVERRVAAVEDAIEAAAKTPAATRATEVYEDAKAAVVTKAAEAKTAAEGVVADAKAVASDAKAKAETVVADTKAKAETVVADTKAKAETVVADTKAKAETFVADAKTAASEEKPIVDSPAAPKADVVAPAPAAPVAPAKEHGLEAVKPAEEYGKRLV